VADDALLNPPPEGVERRPNTVASRLLMGGPVALVTATWRGRHNVIPVAWHMPLSSDPPLIGIGIEQSRYSADLIDHAQAFALNLPTRQLLHHVHYLGSLSGEDVDKFEATQVETFASQKINTPLIEGCAAWVECEVQDAIQLGDHILFVGLVVAVQVDPQAFEDRWLVGDEGGGEFAHVLHFLGGNAYSTLTRALEARVPAPSDAPEAVLRERADEDLEISQEAQERRAERLEQLEREVERGNVVDISELGIEEAGDDAFPDIDLTKGSLLGQPDED
jgi:flavin reductase (DIM6/NTAB) family NADH-FMN oxidoreductase RutF